MRIGILGAGQMAEALGSGWARAGHEVMVGARSPEKARKLAEGIGAGARGGDLRAAAEHGEALLLAVPALSVDGILAEVGAADGALAGRTLIDCTNAYEPDAFTDAPGSFLLTDDAVAERVARLAPGARVVKAFNVCAAEVWTSHAGRGLGVPLCGDDERAVEMVADLVSDLGFEPVRAGGLRRARYLEAVSVFVVGLWFAGYDARQMLPPLQEAFAHSDA
ncbi:NAD(P)-binding domain-containing protein [Nonomuraea sp. NPDC000554]|uniref:NADPH-dependent F420 reductase n=1 Tax=Nonomuraea sp. NPDC000554 TaxID=3154259 RepID=UPI003323648C